MSVKTALMAGVLIAVSAVSADAHRRQRPVALVELPPVEGKGCYFERGVEYCGSYCYWEVNGKRYCQQRQRDAHSQAPVDFFDGSSDGGMK